MSDLVTQGLELAIMGMGFVFVFLILLVLLTTLLSYLVRLTEPDIPTDVNVTGIGAKERVPGLTTPGDARLIAIITAAIREHRRRNTRPGN